MTNKFSKRLRACGDKLVEVVKIKVLRCGAGQGRAGMRLAYYTLLRLARKAANQVGLVIHRSLFELLLYPGLTLGMVTDLTFVRAFGSQRPLTSQLPRPSACPPYNPRPAPLRAHAAPPHADQVPLLALGAIQGKLTKRIQDIKDQVHDRSVG